MTQWNKARAVDHSEIRVGCMVVQNNVDGSISENNLSRGWVNGMYKIYKEPQIYLTIVLSNGAVLTNEKIENWSRMFN